MAIRKLGKSKSNIRVKLLELVWPENKPPAATFRYRTQEARFQLAVTGKDYVRLGPHILGYLDITAVLHFAQDHSARPVITGGVLQEFFPLKKLEDPLKFLASIASLREGHEE